MLRPRIQIAPTFDDAYAGSAVPIGRRRTTASGFARRWTRRKRCAGARSLRLALADARTVASCRCWSTAYVRGCERPHGAAVARAARRGSGSAPATGTSTTSTRSTGRAGSSTGPRRIPPTSSGAISAAITPLLGIVTLRLASADLGDHRCQTAADVAAVLRERGWTGVAHPALAWPAPSGRSFMIVSGIGRSWSEPLTIVKVGQRRGAGGWEWRGWEWRG